MTLIRELGCDIVQGYWTSRPQLADEILRAAQSTPSEIAAGRGDAT